MKDTVLLVGEIDYAYIKKELGLNWTYQIGYASISSETTHIISRGSTMHYNAAYLSKAPNLKTIYILGIGLDHVDCAWCKEKNISVINDPLASIYSVAEMSFAALLRGIRNATTTSKKLLQGTYTRDPMGQNLTDQIVGVCGCGRVGKKLVEMLVAWKAITPFTIMVYDAFASQYDEQAKNNCICCSSLEEMFTTATCISVHIPGVPENDTIVSTLLAKRETPLLYLGNMSRPNLIDETVIAACLADGKLGCYYTDVISGEPIYDDITKEFLNNDRVFVTPHIGANTSQVQEKMLHSCVEKIKMEA